MGLGWQELLIVLIIVLVLFGSKKLPELARSLGTSIKVFKDSSKDPAVDVTPERKADFIEDKPALPPRSTTATTTASPATKENEASRTS